MTYPPLPEPTVIDGRRLYTAGDMREYGQRCFADGMTCKPASGSQYPRESKTPLSPEVEMLADIFGFTK